MLQNAMYVRAVKSYKTKDSTLLSFDKGDLIKLTNKNMTLDRGKPSVWEIDAHTMYNQWATAPGWSLNYPRPKSMTHLRTFSDNGV